QSSLRASPRSLAATNGISVDFFSSGYLDVSVLPVCLPTLCIHVGIVHKCTGFPHSDICGSNASYRLPTAFRRLVRPSSPLTAKASTVYAYSLNHTTPKCLQNHTVCLRFTNKYCYLVFYYYQLAKLLKSSLRLNSNINT